MYSLKYDRAKLFNKIRVQWNSLWETENHCSSRTEIGDNLGAFKVIQNVVELWSF